MKFFFALFFSSAILQVFAQSGKIDTTFNAELYNLLGTGNGPVQNASNISFEQSDGKIIIAGTFSEYAGEPWTGAIRLNTDGSIDRTFDTDSLFAPTDYHPFTAIEEDTAGNLIFVHLEYNNGARSVIYRVNEHGNPDTADVVAGDFYGTVAALRVLSDGKMIFVGSFEYYAENGLTYNDFLRLNADGTVDPSFMQSGGFTTSAYYPTVNIRDVETDGLGRFVVSGDFGGFAQYSSAGLVRIHPDGTVDSTFSIGTGFNFNVSSIDIAPGNKILVGGSFTLLNNVATHGLIRLNTDGTRDFSFPQGDYYSIDHINLMPDSSVVFIGQMQYSSVSYIVRVDQNNVITTATDGNDTQIESAGLSTGYISVLNSLQSGKFMALGQFDSFRGRKRGGVARVNSDFSLDETFAPKPGVKDDVRKALVEPNGKIYVGKAIDYEAYMLTYNDTVVNGLFRVNPDGSLDNTFAIDTSLFVSVEAFARQPNGKVVVAGVIKPHDGSYINGRNVARFNPDGSPDATFNSSVFNGLTMNEVVLQADGKIVVTGNFSTVNGNTCMRICRLNYDGTVDNTFSSGTGPDGNITRTAVTSAGKILITGTFTSYNGTAMQHFGSLNPDGSIDNSFAFDGAANAELQAITIRADGKIYITSQSLVDTDGYGRNILRLNANGSIDQSFTADILNIYATDDIIYALCPLPDGKLLVGGDIHHFGWTGVSGILRLNPDGSLDSGFYSVPELNGPVVRTISLGLNGEIVVAGAFSKFAGKHANNLALLFNSISAYNSELLFTDVSDVSCSGSGTVTALPSGVPPFQYTWDSPLNSTNAIQIITVPGIYTCSAMDATGVISSASVLIDGPRDSASFDLKANMSCGIFRTGTGNTLSINAFNDGCLPVSGQMICVPDSMLTYVSADPAPDYIGNDTLIWNFSNITYSSPHISPVLQCTVSTAAQVGDTISIKLLMTPETGDADTTNNIRAYTFPVMNGYDPNTKSVYPAGLCSEGYIINSQRLTYTVRFQNTGNAEAINIVAVDSLSENLDIRSVHIVGNSHPVWIEVAPGNVAKFHFDEINLPDSNSNEALSHGYVTFEVDPISPNLPMQTVISNKAEIYFDFNPPVVTNSCRNTIFDGDLQGLPCGFYLSEEEISTPAAFRIYPNPTTGSITLVNLSAVTESLQIQVTDLSGKPILQLSGQLLEEIDLNLGSLSNGTYLVTIRSSNSGKLLSTSRIVKM